MDSIGQKRLKNHTNIEKCQEPHRKGHGDPPRTVACGGKADNFLDIRRAGMYHRSTMRDDAPSIHFAPRFHVNFYHSYRGDTPDERGFGKDIRIIRGILDDLDRLAGEGLVVRAAWDFDNAFTLGQILPANAPDIIDRIRARVSAGIDEIELMSWNNGLLSAQTPEEFRLSMRWAGHAPDASGNADVFGSFVPIARPQENMFTASHIPLYRSLGIEAVCLYYSAIPFNGFGSFVPPLGSGQRYNPLGLVDAVSGQSMRLLPCCNQGDLAEYWFSASRMMAAIRRSQLGAAGPIDHMVVLDMDADDSFWAGLARPLARIVAPSFAGLYHLIHDVARLPYVTFTRPWDYLSTHPDRGTLSLPQDLADGAFDGYASWAEKYEDYVVWDRVLHARSLWESAKSAVAAKAGLPDQALDDFGSWSGALGPEHRSQATEAIRQRLRLLSTTHFGMAAPVMNARRFEEGQKLGDTVVALTRAFHRAVAGAGTGPDGASSVDAAPEEAVADIDAIVKVLPPWKEYAGRKVPMLDECVRAWTLPAFRPSGPERWTAAIASCSLRYRKTAHTGFDRKKARRLGRSWDPRWTQLAPMELIAFYRVPARTPIRIWKRDFCGRISMYTLEYLDYGGNADAILNNHVTPGWVAVGDGESGLLVAQADKGPRSLAFCPVRRVREGSGSGGVVTVSLNPYGTWWGPQYRYPARVSGLGRLAAIATADHLFSSAPSWEGASLDFRVLVASYRGDAPPAGLIAAAERFSGLDGNHHNNSGGGSSNGQGTD